MAYTLKPQVKAFLKRALAITVLSALTLTVLAYLIDYAVFRYRVASNRNPYGQVLVQSYDAVGEKSGKTEFIFNPPENQTCAHALFPQSGYEPCWYLQRHSEPRTNI
jgi:hypothetical protein